MFPFTHLFFAWLLGHGFQKFTKKKLSHHTWFFLLFGSILPDIDYLFDWVLKTEIHRTITHSFLFPILAFLSLYLFFTVLPHSKRDVYSSAIAVGIISHLLMDLLLLPGIPLLWPSLLHFSFKGIIYFDPATPSFLHQSISVLRRIMKLAIVDMALGTFWIFYLWFRRDLKF